MRIKAKEQEIQNNEESIKTLLLAIQRNGDVHHVVKFRYKSIFYFLSFRIFLFRFTNFSFNLGFLDCVFTYCLRLGYDDVMHIIALDVAILFFRFFILFYAISFHVYVSKS